jgi:hypothetical protein
MSDSRPHRAVVHWSVEQEALGLPRPLSTIDPAWFAAETPPQHEGWSMVCEFERPPAEQGNPSIARVHYPMSDAPHAKLTVGASLRRFERATSRFAMLEILD